MCKLAAEPVSLIIVRTPFQAWLAEKVIVEEKVKSYDIIYFTQNNSEEDKYYFSVLESRAREAAYFFVTPKRPDIFSHLIFRWMARDWCFDYGYEKVFLSSINAYVPNAVASNQVKAQLITFDDGVANIFKDGGYHQEYVSLRTLIYRNMIGSKSLVSVKKRISRHYTIYKDFENIVDKDYLRFVSGWSGNSLYEKKSGVIKYFIGSPFNEVMRSDQIKRLENYVRNQKVDFYVRHPREKKPLDIGACFLNKKGRIAEDAILEVAAGKDIELIGCLSSVIFNLASSSVVKSVLVPRDSDSLKSLAEQAKLIGCEIVEI